MKKFSFIFIFNLFIFTGSMVFAQSGQLLQANRKTAERCLKLAEKCILAQEYKSAYNHAELGLAYDESVSDLHYIKANCQSKLNYKRADILESISKAFSYNNWVNYNKNSARILYADILCDTLDFQKSLEILNSEPLIYSADAEFIRIKDYYRIGTKDSVAQARAKINQCRKIYPKDERFPKLFFMFESVFLINAERSGVSYKIPQDVVEIAKDYILHFPDYRTNDIEMEVMASMFVTGEEQQRLLRGIGEKTNNLTLYAYAALKAGVISEEKAFNIFFTTTESGHYLTILEAFSNLIKDKELKKNLYDTLNSYSGTIYIDENLDLLTELIVKYERGRAVSVLYDENNDELLEINSECDFGVPKSIRFENVNTDLSYDIYPRVKQVVFKNQSSTFNYLSSDFVYSPFKMSVSIPLKKAGVDFYIPLISSDFSAPDAQFLLRKASSIQIKSDERPGAVLDYTIYKGKPVAVTFTADEEKYAYAQMQGGFPFIRYVDNDSDGQFETAEFYNLDSKGIFNTKDDIAFINKVFGNTQLIENIYLEKIEIDSDRDTIIDFQEEYLGFGGKYSRWDVNGDGRFDEVYYRKPLKENEPLTEEYSFFDKNGARIVTVVNLNSFPEKIHLSDNKTVDVIQGKAFDVYWIGTKGTEEMENIIFTRIGKELTPGKLYSITDKGIFLTVIKVNDKYFCKYMLDN
ncbi:MAG: hypothetical protein IKX23_08705 [Treponema sp.]|nr:hypothetical protein [Treponema sp.]